jgi:hypothetical protein
MVSDSVANGRIWGDLVSAVMGISLAVMIVYPPRRSMGICGMSNITAI